MHIDIAGLIELAAHRGAKYLLTFTDDFTRMVWVHAITLKSQVNTKFSLWKAVVERESGSQIGRIRSDNAKEYVSAAM